MNVSPFILMFQTSQNANPWAAMMKHATASNAGSSSPGG
jgi:hypothetical protein